MFIIFLRFSSNKEKAKDFMQQHNEWLSQGFDSDIFLLAGTIIPAQGGTIIAHNISKEELEKLIQKDPFIIENIVSPEIIEVQPSKIHDTLKSLNI